MIGIETTGRLSGMPASDSVNISSPRRPIPMPHARENLSKNEMVGLFLINRPTMQ